jgi:hypothetical protein
MGHISFRESWLSQTDVNSLLKGDWELDCPRMSLRRKSKKDNDVYKGSGYIRFGKEGTLRFKMYSKQQSDVEPIPWPLEEQIPGKIIPHEEYYTLTAYDWTGRKWVSRCLFPNKDASFDKKGTVLFSDLDLIECSLKTPSYQKENSPWIKFRIRENIEIPYNAATETEIRRKGKIRGSSVSRDFVEFSFDDYKFELRSENKVLDFMISKDSQPFPNNFESRSIEALCFVLTLPLVWNTMEICRGKTTKKIVIRKPNNKTFKYLIQPPITLSLANADSVWNLYCSYLKFIIKFKNPQKLHPISALVRSTILSSTGAIEAHILNLAIAIEGMLNKFYANTGALSETEKKSLNGDIVKCCG